MASFARLGLLSAQAFIPPMGGSASSDVGSGVRDYGSATHYSAVTSGQRMAQKPATAVERVNVMRRPEMISRVPARRTRSRRLQSVPVARAKVRLAMGNSW